jgi:hypothetical protein
MSGINLNEKEKQLLRLAMRYSDTEYMCNAHPIPELIDAYKKILAEITLALKELAAEYKRAYYCDEGAVEKYSFNLEQHTGPLYQIVRDMLWGNSAKFEQFVATYLQQSSIDLKENSGSVSSSPTKDNRELIFCGFKRGFLLNRKEGIFDDNRSLSPKTLTLTPEYDGAIALKIHS